MICAACGVRRDPDDLIAFWPVGDPGRRAFVCRVTRPSPAAGYSSCFRDVVGTVNEHEIGPAVVDRKSLASPRALEPRQRVRIDEEHGRTRVVVIPA